MARQTYYITRAQRHPLYRTRMLQAGAIELDASAARLYRKLGAELSEEQPAVEAPHATVIEGSENLVAVPSLSEAKGPRRRRKKAAE